MASTEERIVEIAEKLEADGINPTQVSVREALGGGSFATIGPILKKWKESKKQDDELAELRVPEVITKRLESLQGAVWQAAVDEADRRLVAEREALHQAQEAAATEVRENLESIAALETEAADYQRKIESLENQAETQAVMVQSLRDELGDVREKAQAEQHSASELLIKEQERREAAEARAERAEALHREAIEQGRADLEALKNEHNTDMSAAKREASEAVKKAEALAQDQMRRAEKAEKEAQNRGAGEQACQSRLEMAQREIDQASVRIAKLEDKAYKAIQEAAELRGELKSRVEDRS